MAVKQEPEASEHLCDEPFFGSRLGSVAPLLRYLFLVLLVTLLLVGCRLQYERDGSRVINHFRPRFPKILHSLPTSYTIGFSNTLAGLLDSIYASLLLGRCIVPHKREMFSEYFELDIPNDCEKWYSPEELAWAQSEVHIYLRLRDLCTREFWNLSHLALAFKGFSFSIGHCSSDLRLRTEIDRITNSSGLPQDAALDHLAYHFLLSRSFRLHPKWTSTIGDMYPQLPEKYNGSHIRTFGFFKDLDDAFGVKAFDTASLFASLDSYLNDSTSYMVLATDSRELRAMVRTHIEGRRGVVAFNRKDTVHSRFGASHFDKATILDIEVLSRAQFLLLTLYSSYSQTIFYRNRNCFFDRCRFAQFLVM